MHTSSEKRLVAYFSHRGQNYVNGGIADLKRGNTEIAAEMAAALTGAELFEIRAAQDYPYLYAECTAAAQRELRADSRPELAETRDISGYDTILLGYPSWFGTMPMPVWTFLSGQGFAGKTILPFCTNEGSGMGNSLRDLRRLCPAAEISAGLSLRGSSVAEAKPALEAWLNRALKEGGRT